MALDRSRPWDGSKPFEEEGVDLLHGQQFSTAEPLNTTQQIRDTL